MFFFSFSFSLSILECAIVYTYVVEVIVLRFFRLDFADYVVTLYKN